MKYRIVEVVENHTGEHIFWVQKKKRFWSLWTLVENPKAAENLKYICTSFADAYEAIERDSALAQEGVEMCFDSGYSSVLRVYHL